MLVVGFFVGFVVGAVAFLIFYRLGLRRRRREWERFLARALLNGGPCRPKSDFSAQREN